MVEPAFLIAMQPVIGGIHIQDDLSRLLAPVVTAQEMIDEKPLALAPIIGDLLVVSGLGNDFTSNLPLGVKGIFSNGTKCAGIM